MRITLQLDELTGRTLARIAKVNGLPLTRYIEVILQASAQQMINLIGADTSELDRTIGNLRSMESFQRFEQNVGEKAEKARQEVVLGEPNQALESEEP